MAQEKIEQSPLVYLVKQLGIQMGDYSKLSVKDKDDLKNYAAEEIAFINLQ